jgi:crossover junction endodeoxyribonuclease RuvC
MKTVLGIDPGLASTGYGIITVAGGRNRHLAHGVITTSPELSPGDRLNKLYQELSQLVAKYTPAEAAVEEIFFAKNSKTYLSVAQAKGVVLLVLAQRGVRVSEYSPLQIKRAVVGNGRAEKVQVQELVRLILGLKDMPEPDHASDALAAAICHGHQAQFSRLAGRT